MRFVLAADLKALPLSIFAIVLAVTLGITYGGPPTVVCGPGAADQAHQTDEHCSISDLEVAAEGFFEIARRWCGL